LPVICWAGDSTTSYSNSQSGTCTSLVYNNDGTATIGFGAGVGPQVGDLISVQLATHVEYNTNFPTAVISLPTASSYTYAITGSVMPSVTPDGTSACISYPLRGSMAGPMSPANMLTKKKFKHINCGMNGNYLSDIVTRFSTDIAVWFPTAVVVSSGINDVYIGGKTLATMQTDMLALHAKCRAIGAQLIILTPFPQQSTRASWTTGKRDIFISWCKWLVRYGNANGVPVVVWGNCAAGTIQVQDPTSTNAAPSANMANADHIHPLGPSAAYLAGKGVAAVLNSMYATGLSGQTVRNVTDGGMFSNPMFTGTAGTPTPGTGTITGTVPDTYTLTIASGSGTVTTSLVARTVAADGDIGGNWFQCSWVAGGAGEQLTIKLPDLVTGQSVPMTNGDTIRVLCEIQLVSGFASCREFSMTCNSQTATTGNLQVDDQQLASSQIAPFPEAFVGTLGMDIPMRTPSGTHGAASHAIPIIQVTAWAAGTIVFQIACASADKLTANG
jgi:hypothetical protein